MRLSSEGILYLSLGFGGSFVFQVLSHRSEESEMQLVLYDGQIYIGARFQISSNNIPSIHPLQIIKVKAEFKSIHRPIQIIELEIIREEKDLMGQQMMSLEQYMESSNFKKRYQHFSKVQNKEEEFIQQNSKGNKKIKPNEEIDEGFSQKVRPDQSFLEIQFENNCRNHAKVIQNSEYKEENKQILKDTQIFQKPQQRVQKTQQPLISKPFINIESDDECEVMEVQKLHTQYTQSTIPIRKTMKQAQSYQQSNTIKPTNPLISKSAPTIPQVYLFLSDLYERISRFRVMCRANYVNNFISQKGRKCTKMIIVDAKGNQMQGMIYQDGKDYKIEKGRVYIFENGQINKDQSGNLAAVFTWKNISLQSSVFLPSFHPDRILTLVKLNSLLQDKLYSFATQNMPLLQKQKTKENKLKILDRQISLIGVFSGLKGEPKLANKGYRINASICNAKAGISIEFSLFIDQLSDIPATCSLISLHNMRIITEGRLHTLQSTPRSYMIAEMASSHPILDSLTCSKNEFEETTFLNLSAMPFTRRKISELLELLSGMEEGEECCSQITGRAIYIKEKREYQACTVCKKESRKEDRVFTYCYNCRKITKFSKRFLFECQLSDNTASLSCTISSDQIQLFIKISVEEFAKMPFSDRSDYLELCSYEEVVAHIKSERVIGGAKHSVVTFEQTTTNANKNIEDIKKFSIAERLRINQVQFN